MSTHALETRGPEETEALGERLGRCARPNAVLALVGDLGAGKTTLVRGLARGLESRERVQSPTFTLHGCYAGRLPLHHFDAYFRDRMLARLDEGLGEEFHGGGVAAIEWAEEIAEHLPEDRLDVELEHLSESRRRIRLIARGPDSRAWLERFRGDLG